MFSNLIESGSHTADLKRKGRFFLGTTIFYGLLLCACGVGSIYAYNARLDEHTDYEVLALMRFPSTEARSEPARREESRPASSQNSITQVATRIEIVQQTPYRDRIASANARETPLNERIVIGTTDFEPGEVGGPVGPYHPGIDGDPNGTSRNEGPAVTDAGAAPAPTPKPAPAPTPRQNTGPISLPSTIISSKTIEKPAPPYPIIARTAGVQGPVAVQIVVDELGHVISAKATSGNPLLQGAAVQAAYKARFTPTLLSGQPVKVTGSITYNFVLR
ncbi:MAG: periplasmic protein TonB [Acidobacteriota bacterium]|jgi:protein TonB|nr:periplasmic protein TonB [Acidobacteriota bacterium]MDT7780936.1 periplasmic protein TonB [Acidobacteriota bacterium]